jgi:hypothetical protein
MGIFDEVLKPASGGASTGIFDEVLKPTPEPRTERAISRGFAGAASFGFLDELEGLARAGGLDPNDEDVGHAIMSLARGAYRKLQGNPEAQKLYEEQVGKSRELTKGLEEQHPYASTAAQVAGAVALPVAAAAKTATMGGRALAAGKTGAVVGGLTGFGQGEGLGGSVTGAAVGAPVGAAVGTVAAPVVEGAVRGVNALAQPFVNRLRGVISPEAEATRQIGIAGARGGGARPGLTPAEFTAEQAAGSPVANVDLLGQEGLALARKATNLSPQAHGTMQDLIEQRSPTTGARLSDWMRGQFHYPDTAAQTEAIEQAARRVNPVAYRRAAQEAAQQHPGGLWDEGFEQISQAPVVQDAIRKASISGGNQAAREGFTPVGNPFQLDRATGRMTLRENGPRPTLQFWDEVKKNLDQVGTRDARDFSRVLRERIDELVPTYGEARAGAAQFFNARDMLQAGQNFVGAAQRYGLPEARRTLANATPAERQLFNDGFASRMIEMLDAKGGAARTTMLNRIQQSRAAQEELALGLGGQAQANAFMARVRVENVMDRLRGAMGNSTTARQLLESGVFGAGSGAALYDPSSWTGTAGLALALRGGNRFVNQRVAERVATMLASQDQAIVERGIRMVANNPTLMRALQGADNSTARTLGTNAPQVTSGIPAMQAGVAGRADENQPQVPGPPQ